MCSSGRGCRKSKSRILIAIGFGRERDGAGDGGGDLLPSSFSILSATQALLSLRPRSSGDKDHRWKSYPDTERRSSFSVLQNAEPESSSSKSSGSSSLLLLKEIRRRRADIRRKRSSQEPPL
ncbi:hypothetical protein MRB53_014308 [Persea americana]|uniref:Uncharacterized protein n=1 Tax=Persea americana TaxID=3435 RepID=A0ACC2KAZ1_PERAE|nr:hypothetical protein MRB53_014308 [Persea americana]